MTAPLLLHGFDYAPLVEAIKREVLDLVHDGTVPRTVRTFSALHDYCDANVLGQGEAVFGMLVDRHGDDVACDVLNAVQTAVHQWLQRSGHRLTNRAIELLHVVEQQDRRTHFCDEVSLRRALPHDPDWIEQDLEALLTSGVIGFTTVQVGDLNVVTYYATCAAERVDELKASPAIVIHATCPHCEFGTPLPADPCSLPVRDGWGFDGSRYICTCDSCGERFVLPQNLAHELQTAALIILGED